MPELSFLLGKTNITADPSAPFNPFDLEPVKRSLALYDGQFNKFLEAAEAIQVVDDGTNAEATALAGRIKELGKRLEKLRKEIVEAPNKYVRTVNTLAKGYTAKLTGAEKALKNQMGQYLAKVELERRKREEARRKAAEEAQKKLNEEAAAAGVEPVKLEVQPEPEAPKVVRTESGSSSSVKVWAFEIVDAQQIPREFLVPDERKIRQAVKDGCREIAGVRIYQDTQIRLRS